MRQKLTNLFEKAFQTKGDLHYFFAPGRVNLIGEHTDYNGGLVFPCALDIGTYAAVQKRDDNIVRLYSENFPEKKIIQFDLKNLENKHEHDWANYPKGVIYTMEKHGFTGLKGFDAVFYGNIPNGAGLSSSASIELLTAVIWNSLNYFKADQVKLVKISQEAENNYIGVNCGIMDQFASGMGKENHAILLDCNTLDFEYAPVELEGMKLIIANTNKRRGLADSKYNERRSECEEALGELKEIMNINHLCDLTVAQFETVQQHITNPISTKRARHAVTENHRTKQAAQKLKAGDLIAFGELMNESHRSLRDDYEVTGEHLDALVEAAWQEEDVVGARMTGAGFGGCTVNLIREEKLEDLLARIARTYKERTGIEPDFYSVNVGAGAGEI